MNLPTAVLGSTAVKHLETTTKAAVLTVGSDTLTRAELARVGCYNFHAARLLTSVLAELKVPSLRYVFEKVPPAHLAVPRLGVISLAVLGAAFEAKKIGGTTPLETYVRSHLKTADGGVRKLVTFDTLKAREAAEVARERKDRKRRKAQRRDQAHALRSERFEQRQTEAPAS